jgi:predicted RNA-binding Zn ribbon-like protein
LNQLLARDEEFGQIAVRDDKEKDKGQASGLMWCIRRRWDTPESLLLPLARSLAELVCAEDFANVKACEGQTCTLLFIDRTRGRGRRWCSMAVCGNRAKQAAHRKRARKTKNRKR